MLTYNYSDFCIEIFEAEGDYSYSNIFYGGNELDCKYGYCSQYGIKLIKDNECKAITILKSSGGKTAPSRNSVIIHNDNLVVLVGKTVFCIALPSLNLQWQKDADDVTCFEIYKVEDAYIIHGEMSITRINLKGEIEWQCYGRDIFVTLDGSDDFKIEGNHVIAKDFLGYIYKFDLVKGENVN